MHLLFGKLHLHSVSRRLLVEICIVAAVCSTCSSAIADSCHVLTVYVSVNSVASSCKAMSLPWLSVFASAHLLKDKLVQCHVVTSLRMTQQSSASHLTRFKHLRMVVCMWWRDVQQYAPQSLHQKQYAFEAHHPNIAATSTDDLKFKFEWWSHVLMPPHKLRDIGGGQLFTYALSFGSSALTFRKSTRFHVRNFCISQHKYTAKIVQTPEKSKIKCCNRL